MVLILGELHVYFYSQVPSLPGLCRLRYDLGLVMLTLFKWNSLIVWQWSSVENAAFPKTDTMHSCRNYEKVVEWAKGHKLEGFNRTIHAHPIPSD